MKATLNLVDHLLARGQHFQTLGRTQDALDMFTQLAGFRQLPREAAGDVQSRLGELYLKRRRYKRAARHLGIALRYQPNEAHLHHLLGVACQAGGKGDLEKAALHYHRALELDGDRIDTLLAFGLLCIQLGRVEEGIGQLRRAAELTPDNPEVVGKLARGLCQSSQADEARQVLRAALFRNSRHPRFRRLWSNFQFQQVRLHQQMQQMNRQRFDAAEREPVILAFVRPTEDLAQGTKGKNGIRIDGPATLPAPHFPGARVRTSQQQYR